MDDALIGGLTLAASALAYSSRGTFGMDGMGGGMMDRMGGGMWFWGGIGLVIIILLVVVIINQTKK